MADDERDADATQGLSIGYLPIPSGEVLLFQLMPPRLYEHASTVLTSNKGFADWGEVFGDDVRAAALIDRVLHDCHSLTVRSNSHRMREYAKRYCSLQSEANAAEPDTRARKSKTGH